MGKRKLTLSVEEDLLEEARRAVASEGGSLSGVVEEYFEYLVSAKWVNALADELGIGGLEPTMASEVPRLRPPGLDAARVVRELRDGRAGRVSR